MTKAALYARVSTDRQEQEETVQSQLAELRARIEADGVTDALEFIDEGYGRDNLMRPALDRLRDLAGRDDLDCVYVQAPDRLASGWKLVFLVEELRGQGVEVLFLKGASDDTPEGKLLFLMQGGIAEYERTKIAERTRRGKQYWARQGALVAGVSPYGYRFIRRSDVQRAHLEVDEYQAAIVREMYRMLVEDRLSLRAIAVALTERGVETPRGAAQWYPTTISNILRNPVHKGRLRYQQTERVIPTRRVSEDPYNRRKTGRRQRPEDDHIEIPVPAIVDEGTWDRAQTQLAANAAKSPRNNKRYRYLLKGLIRCPRCGGTYSGAAARGDRRYRCVNNDPAVSSTGKHCPPGSFRADPVEQAVWESVADALKRPDLLAEQYQRSLVDVGARDTWDMELRQLDLGLKRVARQEDRLTDAYLNEAIDLDRYKAEMDGLKARRSGFERARAETEDRQRSAEDSEDALRDLEVFCRRVSEGLDALTFDERQQLLGLVVERITVDDDRVRIEAIIPRRGPSGGACELRTRHPEALEGCATPRRPSAPSECRAGNAWIPAFAGMTEWGRNDKVQQA